MTQTICRAFSPKTRFNGVTTTTAARRLLILDVKVRIIDTLFGKKPALRLTQAIFYLAWLCMLPNFFISQGRWMSLSTKLFCLSFFTTGLFVTLATKESLIDLWKADSKIGRKVADPIQGTMTQRTMRIIGIGFMIGSLYVGYESLHQ